MKKGSIWITPLRGIVLTLVSFLLHIAPFNTSMFSVQMGNEVQEGLLAERYLSYVVEVHRDLEPAFVRRPLTTWLIEGLSMVGPTEAWSFVIIGFGLFFVCGLLVHGLALQLDHSRREAAAAQVIFHVLPTVLFAFFTPIYTYDEPLQYFFILLSLGWLLKQKWVLFAVGLCGALLARETTLILFPAFLMIGLHGNMGPAKGPFWKVLAALAFPIAAYALFLFHYLPYRGLGAAPESELTSRGQLFHANFETAELAGESLSFLYLAVGLPIFLVLLHAFHTRAPERHRTLVRAFLFTLFINTLIVLVATKAKEARLQFLPVLLCAPLFGRAWLVDLRRIGGLRGYLRLTRYWPGLLLFGFLTCLIVLFSDHLFHLSDGERNTNLHHEYFVAQSVLILLNLCTTAYMIKKGIPPGVEAESALPADGGA